MRKGVIDGSDRRIHGLNGVEVVVKNDMILRRDSASIDIEYEGNKGKVGLGETK